jgi:citrate lyase subunit beta/citryl-CoA lyase
MPGSNSRALEKGCELAADGLILDLEDAVAPDAKELARDQVSSAIRKGGFKNREVIVRVNGLDTPWGLDDLKAVAKMGANAVLLPKVESALFIQEVEKIIVSAGAPNNLKIWCMMETPLGILHSEEIAYASDKVQALVMGTSDLAKDLHSSHTPDRLAFITSISLCILAARAAGISVLDGVYLDLEDDIGFENSCYQGREWGVDGKTLIHPKTIKQANEIFSPSAYELEWSKKIIAAHALAAERGEGIVVLDGKLIENLHVINAKRLVEMAEVIESMKQELN